MPNPGPTEKELTMLLQIAAASIAETEAESAYSGENWNKVRAARFKRQDAVKVWKKEMKK